MGGWVMQHKTFVGTDCSIQVASTFPTDIPPEDIETEYKVVNVEIDRKLKNWKLKKKSKKKLKN